jgi:hypothetical protein
MRQSFQKDTTPCEPWGSLVGSIRMIPTFFHIPFSPAVCSGLMQLAKEASHVTEQAPAKKSRGITDHEDVVEVVLGVAEAASAKKPLRTPDDEDVVETALVEDALNELASNGESAAGTAPVDTSKTMEPVATPHSATAVVKPTGFVQPRLGWKNERNEYGPNSDPCDSDEPDPKAASYAETTPYNEHGIPKGAAITPNESGGKQDRQTHASDDVGNEPFDNSKIRQKYKYLNGEMTHIWDDLAGDATEESKSRRQRHATVCSALTVAPF